MAGVAIFFILGLTYTLHSNKYTLERQSVLIDELHNKVERRDHIIDNLRENVERQREIAERRRKLEQETKQNIYDQILELKNLVNDKFATKEKIQKK